MRRARWEIRSMKSNEASAHPWMANSLADIKQAMLAEIGAKSVEELFEQIPVGHRLKAPLKLPKQLKSEA
jgi:glycine dehydrogenase subunit 1